MKVTLINCGIPDFITNKEYMMSPAVLQLAGVLDEQHIKVEIIDLNTAEFPTEIDANIVGISCLFSGQFPQAIDISKRVKEINPNTIVIIGGIHATIFYREILENINTIDYVIIGEGESQLLSIINKTRLDDGIAFRWIDKRVAHFPKTKFIQNLDELPLPAYHLINFDKYRQDLSHWYNPKGLKFDLTVPIITSRSCPMKCTFCSNKLIMGSRIRFRSPSKVLGEIAWLYRNYRQNRFSFIDDNLAFNPQHIMEICKGILSENLNIQWETPNGMMIRGLTYKVVDLMAESGWVRGMIPIESGNDYIRNQIMQKNLPREDIYRIINYIKKNHPHIYLRGLFIMGMPEDTPETLQDTYNIIKDLSLDTFSIANIMPFPGTRIYKQALRDNLFTVPIVDFWKEVRFDYNDNKQFYIKPYAMTVEELQRWRLEFDNLKQGV
jgi:radical SAM superfamily enzyme YgiQ (UPF0313 family)